MQIVQIQAQQSFQCYARKGQRFHLNSGQVVLYARSDLDAYSYTVPFPLAAGAEYTAQQNGWLTISADRLSEVVRVAPKVWPRALVDALRFFNGQPRGLI